MNFFLNLLIPFLYNLVNFFDNFIVVIIVLQHFVLDIIYISENIFDLLSLRIDFKRQVLNIILIFLDCLRQIFLYFNYSLWIFFLICFNLLINSFNIFKNSFFKWIKLVLKHRKLSCMLSISFEWKLNTAIQSCNDRIYTIKDNFGYIIPFLLIEFKNCIWILLYFNNFGCC